MLHSANSTNPTTKGVVQNVLVSGLSRKSEYLNYQLSLRTCLLSSKNLEQNARLLSTTIHLPRGLKDTSKRRSLRITGVNRTTSITRHASNIIMTANRSPPTSNISTLTTRTLYNAIGTNSWDPYHIHRKAQSATFFNFLAAFAHGSNAWPCRVRLNHISYEGKTVHATVCARTRLAAFAFPIRGASGLVNRFERMRERV
ncbi:hypothetical protein BU16DRAFT_527171 [Lophium mytilinum]|uniref:Uncharacterized protein n=1 Tax=Lophium mytilinum TaxID=390894 RepID=A0A6A6QTL4_9PEZI|nr:hypothetical protein BU16DRAFT_527171 [Lophium mytilinum]